MSNRRRREVYLKKTVVVTGGAGYIGSMLVRLLLEKEYNVKVVDRLFFGLKSLKDILDKITLIKADIRDVRQDVFEGAYAVLDLAALSNDPAGELDPQKTLDINYLGRVRVAHLAKRAGVKRYVLASSCSIYGVQEEELTEESPVNPLTTYAEANYLAEQAILPLASDKFAVTALRQATVYGFSHRMRFDLAINGMTGALFTYGKIKILRDGTQWRPFIHVKDTSKAFIKVIEAEPEKVNGEIFNVGSNKQNIQIFELAKLVAKAAGKKFEYEWYGDPDKRSYRVRFDKIQKLLKYKPDHTIEDGVKEIWQALEKGITKWDDPTTRTVNWYKTLLEWKEKMDEILWREQIL